MYWTMSRRPSMIRCTTFGGLGISDNLGVFVHERQGLSLDDPAMLPLAKDGASNRHRDYQSEVYHTLVRAYSQVRLYISDFHRIGFPSLRTRVVLEDGSPRLVNSASMIFDLPRDLSFVKAVILRSCN